MTQPYQPFTTITMLIMCHMPVWLQNQCSWCQETKCLQLSPKAVAPSTTQRLATSSPVKAGQPGIILGFSFKLTPKGIVCSFLCYSFLLFSTLFYLFFLFLSCLFFSHLLNGLPVHVVGDFQLREVGQLAPVTQHDLHVAAHRAGPTAAVPATTQLTPTPAPTQQALLSVHHHHGSTTYQACHQNSSTAAVLPTTQLTLAVICTKQVGSIAHVGTHNHKTVCTGGATEVSLVLRSMHQSQKILVKRFYLSQLWPHVVWTKAMERHGLSCTYLADHELESIKFSCFYFRSKKRPCLL